MNEIQKKKTMERKLRDLLFSCESNNKIKDYILEQSSLYFSYKEGYMDIKLKVRELNLSDDCKENVIGILTNSYFYYLLELCDIDYSFENIKIINGICYENIIKLTYKKTSAYYEIRAIFDGYEDNDYYFIPINLKNCFKENAS